MTDFVESTNDAYIRGFGSDWATAHSTSDSYDSTGTAIFVGQYYDATPYYAAYRGFLKFDTSSIGSSGVVTQVNLKLTCTVDNSTTNFDVQIVKLDWSAYDPISAGNRENAFDACIVGTADDNIWRNTSGMSINTQYTSGNLSNSWINKTGYTYYGLRSSLDYNNTSPTDVSYIYIASQEHATTAYRPILTITYTAGLANVKTVNGLGTASVKTVNGLAIASVKSIDGLA